MKTCSLQAEKWFPRGAVRLNWPGLRARPNQLSLTLCNYYIKHVCVETPVLILSLRGAFSATKQSPLTQSARLLRKKRCQDTRVVIASNSTAPALFLPEETVIASRRRSSVLTLPQSPP